MHFPDIQVFQFRFESVFSLWIEALPVDGNKETKKQSGKWHIISCVFF